MVLLHLFDESQTRLADFGYIPECKSKHPRGLNEISGWSGGAMVLGKLPVPGRPTIG